jgi:GTP-binding protein HflX
LSKSKLQETRPPKEKALLIGVEIHGLPSLLSLDDSLRELSLLAETAGVEIVGETYQRISHPNPNTLIGAGKVEEIRLLADESSSDLVIFDIELSPRHQRELEELLGPSIKVIDRTALILDIFAQHANTREGALQVELAQLEYRLPRLTRAWTHLARQAGGGAGRTGSVGGVGLRGPGETQLEVDRREIRKKISVLKNEIEKVHDHRTLYRTQRKKTNIPVVSIVGYTNAGKSTLLNALTNSNVLVADKLFATLDPTTRRITLPEKHVVLLTDTVGFIQKLPTTLVAAFRATLEEITEADLLVHVVDITHPNALAQAKSVQETLKEIDAENVAVITVLNKIDRLDEPENATVCLSEFENAVAISALKGQGLSELLKKIENSLFETNIPVKVKLPYQEGQLIALFHDQGIVNKVSHLKEHMTIQGSLPARIINRFERFIIRK